MEEILVKEAALNEYWQLKLEELNDQLTYYPIHSKGINVSGSIDRQLNPKLLSRIEKLSKGNVASEFTIYTFVYGYLVQRYFNLESAYIATPEIGKYSKDLTLLNLKYEVSKDVKQGLASCQKEISRTMKAGHIRFIQNSESRKYLNQFVISDCQLQGHIEIPEDIGFHLIVNRDTEKRFKLYYHPNRFSEVFATQFLAHFEALASAMFSNLKASLESLDYLSQDEINHLLTANGNTQEPYKQDETIVSIFKKCSQRHKNRVAVRYEGKSLTYAELDDLSDQVAAFLTSDYGIKKNMRVGVMMNRTDELVVSILAILKCGAAYVPIDPLYPEDRIFYTLKDSSVDALIIDDKQWTEKEALKGCSVLMFEDAIRSSGTFTPHEIEPHDLAYIIYTSGTTGHPKGVMVEHGNVLSLLTCHRFPFEFKETDVWTLFHSYCFDFSVWEIFGALLFGGSVVVVPKHVAQTPTLFADLLEMEQVTVLNQIPTMFNNLLQEVLKEGKSYSFNIRYVIFGGEALNPASLSGWQKKYPDVRLINMYGITETTVHVTYKEITGHDIETGLSNIGRPIPALSCYLMDEHKHLVPDGVIGEIVVGGYGVSRGYLNRPELTNERFINNPYKPAERLYCSGDLGLRLAHGEIKYIGRKDHQVKVRGFRIELGEIENALVKYQGIFDTIVVAQKDEQNDDQIIAYVQGNPETIDIPKVRDFLGEFLPDYMIPAYIITLDVLPKTMTGKINRKELPHPKEFFEKERAELVSPRTNLETQMASIWKEVLSLKHIGITQNYFAIGGDSIKAIRLISRCAKELNIQLSIREVFEYPTIELLASFIENDLSETFALDLDKARETVEAFRFQDEFLPLAETAEDLLPMSDIAQGMIFTSIAADRPGVYHIQDIYKVSLDYISEKNFLTCIEQLVDKHSILRSAFNALQFSVPCQIIFPAIEVKNYIHYHDLRGVSKEEQSQRVQSFLDRDLNSPFQFEMDILWRIELFQINDNDLMICFVHHHAIMDGWSNAAFFAELLDLYQQVSQNKEFKTKRLHSSYKAYIIEQEAVKTNDELKTYWKNSLAEYERFSFAINETHSKSFKYVTEISTDLFHSAQKLADTKKISVKSIFLSAYLYALGSFSYSKDLLVGLVENNRPLVEDGERILGCFLNTVPFRKQLDSDINGLGIINDIQRQLTELKRYARLPLPAILESIGENPVGENPMFDVLFNYIDFHVYDEVNTDTVEGVELELKAGGTNTKFDVTISTTLDKCELDISASNAFVTEAVLGQFVSYFHEYLEQLVHRPDEKISVYMKDSAVVNTDNNEQYRDLLQTETVLSLFRERVKKSPARVAVSFKGEDYTYQELDDISDKLAHTLLETHQVQPEDRVGVLMNRSPELMISLLGILKTEAAYVPIDPNYPQERIDYILRDSGARCYVTRSDFFSLKFDLPRVDIASIIDLSIETIKPHALPKPSQLAYVIYTSGSTGKPKGVMVEHRSMLNLCLWTKDAYGITEESKGTLYSGIGFDASVLESWPFLVSGASLYPVLEELRLDIERLFKWYNSHEISHSFLPTKFVEQIASFSNLKLNTPLKILTGGDELKQVPNLQNLMVYNNYGPTEATVVSTMKRLDAQEKHIGIGTPISNGGISIRDKWFQPMPYNALGELCISGAGLARGYLNKEEMTNERFIEIDQQRVYRSGDLCRFNPEFGLEYFGRIDDQIQIRGFRVELGEIESVLLQHEALEQAVVLADETVSGQCLLHGFVTSSVPIEPHELQRFLNTRLPDYMVPNHFYFLNGLPLTANGKTDKQKLRVFIKNGAGNGKKEKPETDEEKRLFAIFTDVLKTKNIGIQESFFEIGGNSLLAMQLVSAIRKIYPHFGLSELFRYPSIKLMAVFFSNGLAERALNNIVPLTPLQTEKENILMVHPASGDVFGYQLLAEQLSSSVNVYGIRANGFSENDTILHTIEEMAASYFEQIKKLQENNFILVGYSISAPIVFEIAKKIEGEGKQVKHLILIDRPANEGVSWDAEAQLEELTKDFLAHAFNLEPTDFGAFENSNDLLKNMYTQFQDENNLVEGISYQDAKTHQTVVKKLLNALKLYRVNGEVTCPIHYFFTEENQRDDYGWQRYTRSEVVVQKLKGTHLNLLEDPHIKENSLHILNILTTQKARG